MHHYAAAAGAPTQPLTMDDMNRVRPAAHAAIAGLSSSNIFAKTHSAITAVKGIPTITPSLTKGAVYIVRNPLDVAVSYANHFSVDLDRAIEALCHSGAILKPNAGQVFQVLGSWTDHVASWCDRPDLLRHVMRYEDMRTQPAETFSRLLQFLGLPDDAGRRDQALRFADFKELRRQEDAAGFSEKPATADRFFREGRTGGWADVLTSQQVRKIVDAHRKTMKRFGYLDSLGQPVQGAMPMA